MCVFTSTRLIHTHRSYIFTSTREMCVFTSTRLIHTAQILHFYLDEGNVTSTTNNKNILHCMKRHAIKRRMNQRRLLTVIAFLLQFPASLNFRQKFEMYYSEGWLHYSFDLPIEKLSRLLDYKNYVLYVKRSIFRLVHDEGSILLPKLCNTVGIRLRPFGYCKHSITPINRLLVR